MVGVFIALMPVEFRSTGIMFFSAEVISIRVISGLLHRPDEWGMIFK